MVDLGLDALIATSPENVIYASDHWAMSQWLRRGPQVYVVLPRNRLDQATLVTFTSNIDLLVDEPTWIGDVRRYGYFPFAQPEPLADGHEHRALAALLTIGEDPDPLSSLVSAIEDSGLAEARLGVDEIGIQPRLLDRLRTRLPGAEISYASEAFRRIRAVKTSEEVARLRAAAQITERAIDASLDMARAGVTEREVAEAFECSLVRAGAVPCLTVIGFGARTAYPNVQPGKARLRVGDLIRFDVGCVYRHYRADISRCAVLGQPDAKTKRIFEAILEGERVGIAVVRAGAMASDVYEAAMEAVSRRLAHYERGHVGHGIGIDSYDQPSLAPEDHTVLEAGMVMCVETPYYELGWGGLQVEDTVAVGPGGPTSLMARSSELRVLEQ